MPAAPAPAMKRRRPTVTVFAIQSSPPSIFMCFHHYIRSRLPGNRGPCDHARTKQREGLMAEIRTQLLFTITLRVGKIQTLGRTPLDERRTAVVDGGSFEGPKLSGTVLEGGSDW